MTKLRALNFGPSLVDDKGNVTRPEEIQARQEGYDQGQQDSKSSLEAQIDTTLVQVREKLTQLIDDQQQAFKYLDWTVLEISRQITNKMIPYQLEDKATHDVESFVREFMKNVSQHTQLTISCHPDVKNQFDERVAKGDFSQHENVTIKVEANKDLSPGDCQLSWDDGGIDRLRGHIQSEIDRIFQSVLDNVPIGKVEEETKAEAGENE